MTDLTKYEQMRDHGVPPEEIYALARFEQGSKLKRLWFIRQLFDVPLPRARRIMRHGDETFFEQYILPPYKAMQETGASAQAVYQKMLANGVSSGMLRLKIIRTLFELSFAETIEIALAARTMSDNEGS
jgi:hypothetical protein